MKAYFASPISDQFNESYGQRGLQPSTGRVTPVRNVSVDYKNDPTVRRGVRTVSGGEMQSDKNATVQYKNVSTQEVPVQTKSDSQEQVAIERKNVARSSGKKRSFNQSEAVTTSAGGKRKLFVKAKAAGKAAAYARAAGATSGIWSWGFFVWLWFQVPIAIISLVAMGLHQAFYSIWASEVAIRADENLLQAAGRTAVELLLTPFRWAVQTFLNFFDIDPNIVGTIFMMMNFLVMAIGWLILFTGLFLYSVGRIKGVTGEKGGLKAMAFVGAMVAYAIPFVNIFPWFFLWTLTVMKNPK